MQLAYRFGNLSYAVKEICIIILVGFVALIFGEEFPSLPFVDY